MKSDQGETMRAPEIDSSETVGEAVAALKVEASRAMLAGDPLQARVLLQRALSLRGNDPGVWLNLAATNRACQDFAAALAAVEQALCLAPRFFHALLMRASLLEREGRIKAAARAYAVAFTQAPADSQMDAATLQAVQHGRVLYRKYQQEMRAYLDHAVPSASTGMRDGESRRLAAFIDSTLGLKSRYRQEPTDYFYPGLPAIEFWEREEFPWLADLEAATQAIQRELVDVMRSDDGFAPYVDYPDGIPLDQWAALNRSLSWSAFHFYHHGRRYQENCLRCPNTMETLARVPQPHASGRMPAAMFSVLKPQTRIPPHTGVANVRLVVHLPLVVPAGCGFRVGSETREWRVGEAWVFDDTIEHEAWNTSDEVRVVLICDVWNPRLSASERDAISAVMAAMDSFNELVPKADL